MKKDKNLMISFIGDKGVGKTTFIEQFTRTCEQKDEKKNGEKIYTKELLGKKQNFFITEYSEIPEEKFFKEIQKNLCICILFNMEERESFVNLLDKWIIWLRDTVKYERPIIILGTYEKENKDDLSVDEEEINLMIDVSKIESKFFDIGMMNEDERIKMIDKLIVEGVEYQKNEKNFKGGKEDKDKKCVIF